MFCHSTIPSRSQSLTFGVSYSSAKPVPKKPVGVDWQPKSTSHRLPSHRRCLFFQSQQSGHRSHYLRCGLLFTQACATSSPFSSNAFSNLGKLAHAQSPRRDLRPHRFPAPTHQKRRTSSASSGPPIVKRPVQGLAHRLVVRKTTEMRFLLYYPSRRRRLWPASSSSKLAVWEELPRG